MKILHVITTIGLGGAQLQLLRLIRGMQGTHYEFRVCVLWPVLDLAERFRDAGAEVVPVYRRSSRDISIVWRLAQQISAYQPDILQTWLFDGNTWGRLATLLAHRPKVIATLTNAYAQDRSPWYPCVNRCLTFTTDVIYTNSLAAARECQDWRLSPRRGVVLVRNGEDVAAFDRATRGFDRSMLARELQLVPGWPVIGTVGRLSRQKDHVSLLQAVNLLKTWGIRCHLVIIGEGPLRRELTDRIHDWGLTQEVILAGSRTDVPQLLHGLDVFALSSRWEGFPQVTLEAMAARLPVVTTNAGGAAEAVEDGVTGLVVPPENPDRLARALEALIVDPQRARQMGDEGRRRVEQTFTEKSMIEETSRLYQSLLI